MSEQTVAVESCATIGVDQMFVKRKALIPLVIAGDGSLLRTQRIMQAMAENGADGIGVVLPFSDPLMESEAMCAAQARAMRTQTTPDAVFQMMEQFRNTFDIPVYIEVYTNCVFAYGYERFAASCARTGVSAVLVKDSNYETVQEFAQPFHDHNVFVLSTINWASDRRDYQIAQQAEGFLCCFSHRRELPWPMVHECMMLLRAANRRIPCVIDLPYPEEQLLQKARNYVDGVQISDAISNLVEQYGTDAPQWIAKLMRGSRAAFDTAEG